MESGTTATLTIAAPPATVLAVIADFGEYPHWASAIRSVETLARDGQDRATRVRFSLDAGLVRDSYVLAYDWEPGPGVSWQLAEPGSMISAMTGAYRLAGSGQSTEVTYELAVDLRVPMPGMLKRKAEKIIIDTALRGLKSRV